MAYNELGCLDICSDLISNWFYIDQDRYHILNRRFFINQELLPEKAEIFDRNLQFLDFVYKTDQHQQKWPKPILTSKYEFKNAMSSRKY